MNSEDKLTFVVGGPCDGDLFYFDGWMHGDVYVCGTIRNRSCIYRFLETDKGPRFVFESYMSTTDYQHTENWLIEKDTLTGE